MIETEGYVIRLRVYNMQEPFKEWESAVKTFPTEITPKEVASYIRQLADHYEETGGLKE